jgi:thiol-disulfide isomerase/thioredoxin
MKKVLMIITAVMLLIAAFAGCGSNNTAPSASQTPAQSKEQLPAAWPSATPAQTSAGPQSTESAAEAYSFEFEDVDGNVHKLSDYAGRPVYLEIWGTWCSVCMSSLPELDAFAGEKHDFAVLSVVSPGASGEKNKEDFIAWYKEQGYKNLTVLLDEKWQIVNDFGVNAYPSIIIFDSSGVPVTGFAGLMPKTRYWK